MKRILSLCLIFCLSFSISAFAIEPMSFVGGSEFVYAKSFNSYGIALAGVDANLDGIIELGVINADGEKVFGFDGSKINVCPNGLIMKLGENNMIAFFDKEGKQLTDYVYDAYVNEHPKTGEKNYLYFNTFAGDGRSDLVRVSRNFKFGYINSKAEEVIEPQYDYVYGFYNGISRTASGGKLSAYGTYIDSKYGFIDEEGKTLFAPDALWYASDFTDDLVTIADGQKKTIDKNGKVFDLGFVDDYNAFRSNGKLIVCYSEKENTFCLFDYFGNVIFPITIEDILLFGDYAIVGGKRIVNKNGDIVKVCDYGEKLGIWTGDKNFLRITKNADNYKTLYGFMNENLETVFEPVYTTLRDLGEGIVFAKDENGKGMFYDYEGKPLSEFNGDVESETFACGLLPVLDYDTMKYIYIKNPLNKSSINASSWAMEEVVRAKDNNLIPEKLLSSDFKENITREEFASVCVKLYEKMLGKNIENLLPNPFDDCDNEDVIKAYSVGIVNGVSDALFAPDDTLTREQAATMLSRAYALSFSVDLVTAGPPSAKLPLYYMIKESNESSKAYNHPTLFADDKLISDWAKHSVYFMNVNEIIKGMGEGKFEPQGTLTSEQAVLLALRLWECI